MEAFRWSLGTKGIESKFKLGNYKIIQYDSEMWPIKKENGENY